MLVKCIKWRREFGVESLSESDADIKTEVETGKVQLLRHRDFYGRLLERYIVNVITLYISSFVAGKFLKILLCIKIWIGTGYVDTGRFFCNIKLYMEFIFK